MTAGPAAAAARRARRLLWWYPARWRARYGAEFAELLLADLAERPRSWRRTTDVARSGLRARLAAAGLASHPLDPARAARAGLATLTGSAAAFVTTGTAMWAQLTIGWQWARPATPATTVAMIVMSGALALLVVLALLAAIPVAWAVISACASGRGRALACPALLTALAATLLVAGGRHFGTGWPGTGGRWWPLQGLVPHGLAAFGWACTLSVTSYWAHPAALAAFPPAELAWMVVSPLMVGSLAIGAIWLVRRVELSPAAMRYVAWLGTGAGLAMAVFLGGALCWVTEGGAGPDGLFRTGTIDRAVLAVMAAALVTGWAAVCQARRRVAG